MKSLILTLVTLSILLFSSSFSSAQTILFEEDFETGVPGSLTESFNSGALSFGVNGGVTGVSFPYAGSNSASFFDASYTPYSTNLITPSIDMSFYSDVSLSFAHVQKRWSGDNNELGVYVSNDGGTTWVLINYWGNRVNNWQVRNFNLQDYISLTSDMKIRFTALNAYGYSLGLDEIIIETPESPPSPASSITVDYTTSNSAGITISPSSSSWDLEFGAVGFTVGTGTRITGITSNSYHISGLSEFTTYDVYVKGDLDADWVSVSGISTGYGTYPVFQNFTPTGALPVVEGWLTSGDFPWYITDVADAAGNVSEVLWADCWGESSGSSSLFSPIYDLRGITTPVMHFQIAHATYTASNDDSLKIYISNDGGQTYNSTPVFDRSRNTSPSLSTVPDQTTEFVPSSSSDWVSVALDLAAYAGDSSLVLKFVAVSDYGNNIYVDDIRISDAASVVTDPISSNVAVTNAGITIDFSDYANGGDLQTSRYTDVAPQTTAAQEIATNASATTNDGAIFTPDVISANAWWSVTYSGDNFIGDPSYNVSIDLSEFGPISDKDRIYIMKRANENASWVALNTTLSGDILTATGLTSFSDFAIGGEIGVLAVEIEHFTAWNAGTVNELEWATAAEFDNSHFIIERSEDAVNWEALGQVAGQGTTYETTHYDWTDYAPLRGGSYYRLIDVEFNGRRTASDIAFVPGQVTGVDQPVLHPNPTPGSAWLTIPDLGSGEVSVIDAAGRVIQRLPVDGPGTIAVDLSQEASGIYLVRFEHAAGVWNTRLVRN